MNDEPEQNNRILRIPIDGGPPPEELSQLRVAVGVHNGRVIITFGEPVAYVGLEPKAARAIAIKIIQASDSL